VGEEITLMGWGNAIVREVVRDAEGKLSLVGELHLEGSVKSTKKKITWLADEKDQMAANVELIDLDHLLAKDKPEEDDTDEELYNKTTMYTYPAKCEAALRLVHPGQVIQIERRGFYICDKPFIRTKDPMRFIFVPDGKNMMGFKPK
jgi:glutamyl-tRNA synthetase